MTEATGQTTGGTAGGRRGGLAGRLVRQRETGLVLVILLLFAVMSFASPYFLTWENMRAMTMAFAVEGIVVVGMTILLISGGIDLSVGSVVAFAMVLAGWLFLQGVDPGSPRGWRSSPPPASASPWASASPASGCTTSSCRSPSW